MGRLEAAEITRELDLEFWFERESLAYRLSRGASGLQVNARDCPNCGDRRYRVYLNAESGVGNCFCCNLGYTKLKFIKINTGLEWRDTFRYCEDVLKEQGWRPKRKVETAVEMEKATFPTSFALPTPAGENLTYLEGRGFTADVARYFHLRYCHEGWWNFTKDDGTRGGQAFHERVIIPVFDLDGTFVTYQGRDITGAKTEDKYLFPKGLPGTGRYLLNGQNAWRHKQLCLGEGFADVASIRMAFDGTKDLASVAAAGTFGKHLSSGSPDGDDQLGRLLQLKGRGLQVVTIMWDGGKKELDAALSAARTIKASGLMVRIALLPKGRDPNEVTPDVVVDAYRNARLYDAKLELEWKMRSPYASAL